jgi:signal transduction histidine kinase
VEAAVDVLLGALCAVVAVRAVVDRASTWPAAVGLTLGVVVAYAVGTVPVRRRGRAATVWFAVVVGLWVALIALDVNGVYIGFGLFFVAFDRFEPRPALAIVAACTLAVLAAEAFHLSELGVAAAIGPAFGAVAASAMSLAYRSLEHENDQRRALIADLERTRGELAASEHARGVLSERERLAREIHDTVAQGLASIALLLGAAESDLGNGDARSALANVRSARETARRDLEEARRFVRELAPPDLASQGLIDALDRLCRTADRPGDLEVAFAVSGEPGDVQRSAEVALYRVAQSALANTATHARAREARVTLSFVDDLVLLDVVDDGQGFDPEPLVGPGHASGNGFGFTAMRQRVAAVGGTLSVESEPGGGTAVSAAVPRHAPRDRTGLRDQVDPSDASQLIDTSERAAPNADRP